MADRRSEKSSKPSTCPEEPGSYPGSRHQIDLDQRLLGQRRHLNCRAGRAMLAHGVHDPLPTCTEKAFLERRSRGGRLRGPRDLLLTRPAWTVFYPIPARRVAVLLHASFRPSPHSGGLALR